MANRDMNREETRGTTRTSAELARLSDLDDYKVAEGDPDIRKWDVRAPDGTKLGKVHDLIVDTREMKVRYIDAELDHKAIGTDKDRHTLIPIGTARLNDHDDDVIISQIPSHGFSSAPVYDHGRIQPEDETAILGAYGGSANRDQLLGDRHFWGARRTGRESDAYFTRSEEELSIDTRQRKAGEVEVRKDVETRHVSERVPVMKEEVIVERRPATGATAKPGIGKDEIRVPVMEEEVEVRKRAVPKEEVVIRKEARRDEKVVEADLKRERIDVESKPNPESRDRR
ncbi:MAG TPA: DUF2382 domain-containing protein [Gemmatimonadaceae bacterium]|nr:DUF2382 domain-containing protein [Gemmatimonadaceae bacterium]